MLRFLAVAILCFAAGESAAVTPQPAHNSDGSPRVLPPGPPAIAGRTLILDYYDFGPQAMSLGLVGQAWWQWAECACFEPDDQFDLRVVVYRGIALAQVQQRYPTVKHRADYRYLDYRTAIAYLDDHIAELAGDPEFARLRADLIATRAHIVATL